MIGTCALGTGITLDPDLKTLIMGWLQISFLLICMLLVAAATAKPIQIYKCSFGIGRLSPQERRFLLATALFFFVISSFLFFFLYIHLKPVKPMNTLKKSQTPEANLKKSPPSPSAGSPVPEAKTFPSNKPSQYLEKAPQVITPAPRRAESRGNNRSNRIEPQPLEDLTPEPAQPHIDLPGETGDPIGFPGVR